MPGVQFMLTIDVLESLVIGIEDERPSFEIMTLLSRGSHNSIELFVIVAIVASRRM